MGFIYSIAKLIIKLVLYVALFVAIILLIPNLPPYTTFSNIELEPTLPLVGTLKFNGMLNNAEKLYKGELLGPEAFQLHNGEVYTGLQTGEIVKISSGGHVTFVTQIGRPCSKLSEGYPCGRPLGFKIDEKRNIMYVADTFLGIWKVNLKSDVKQLLVTPHIAIDGRKPKTINSVALHSNGDLYWTDSSSDFDLLNGAFILFSDPSGRVFHYDAVKNESTVLVDNVYFANGIVISPDETFLVVSETCKFRLLKHYIAGPKKGKTEVFIAGLPGTPDNLRALPDGSGLLIALYHVYNDEQPNIVKTMAPAPLVRKFIARTMRLVEMSFEFLNSLYPHYLFEEIIFVIGHLQHIPDSPHSTGLIQTDWNGNIIASYFNTDGTVGAISDAIVHNDKLYLGCPHITDYIAAVPVPPLLKKAFTSTKSSEHKTARTIEKEITTAGNEKNTQDSKYSENINIKTTNNDPKVYKPVEREVPKAADINIMQSGTTENIVSPQKNLDSKPPPNSNDNKKPQKVIEKNLPTSSDVKTAAKPTENLPPKVAETKSTTKPVTKEPTLKPLENKTPTQKTQPQIEKPKQTSKPDAKKSETVIKQTETKERPVAQQIPIKEEIPSDTVKASKEKLKVIKKNGPAEIPNPNL